MRRRLLLSYLTITVLVLIGLEVPLGFSFARSEQRRLRESVHQDAVTLATRAEEDLESGPDAAGLAELESLVSRYEHETGDRVVVADANGHRLASSEPADIEPERNAVLEPPEILRALNGHESSGNRYSGELHGNLYFVAAPVESGNSVIGAVRVTHSTLSVDHRVRDNWLLLATIGGGVLAVVFVVSLLVARSVTRPLAELSRAASRLGRRRARRTRAGPGRADGGTPARPGVQHHRDPTRGARRRAAVVRRRRVTSAANAAGRASAAPRESGERGEPGRRRRRRRGPSRGRTPDPPRRRAAGPGSSGAQRAGTDRRRRRRRDRRPPRRLARVRHRARRTPRGRRGGRAVGSGHARAPRAGPRQPAEQRPRARPRRQHGQPQRHPPPRPDRDPGPRHRPRDDRRRPGPSVRSLLAAPRAPRPTTAASASAWPSCASWSPRTAARSSCAPPLAAGWRRCSPCGPGPVRERPAASRPPERERPARFSRFFAVSW